MDKNISYAEYISEKVNQNLSDYSNYVAQEISYTDYLSEKLDSNLKWNKRRESRRKKIKVIFE